MKNLDEFLASYNPHNEHPVTEIEPGTNGQNDSPFIILRSGGRVMVVNPIAFGDNLSIDIHSFVNGEAATAGVFGMTKSHRRVEFPATGTTSHGFPSACLVAVLLGAQGTD